MKFLSILLALAFATQACNKNTLKTTSDSLMGTWELRSTFGGNIAPATFPPSSGNKVSFDGTNYKVYEGGQLTFSSSYKIQNANGLNYIIYGDNSQPIFNDTYTIHADTLTLIPNHPDFATRVYLKINNSATP